MAKHNPLVSQYLEAISGTALDKYQRVIRAYVRNGMASMRCIDGTSCTMSASRRTFVTG